LKSIYTDQSVTIDISIWQGLALENASSLLAQYEASREQTEQVLQAVSWSAPFHPRQHALALENAKASIWSPPAPSIGGDRFILVPRMADAPLPLPSPGLGAWPGEAPSVRPWWSACRWQLVPSGNFFPAGKSWLGALAHLH